MKLKTTVLIVLILGWASTAAVFVWLTQAAEDQRADEIREDLHRQALVLRAILDPASPGIDTVVDDISRNMPYRVTVIAPDGKVLADSNFSNGELAELENHSDRTEIVDARRSGVGYRTRYSTSVGTWLTYSAVPYEDSKGFIRLSVPLPQQRLIGPQFRLPLVLLTFVLLTGAGLISHRLRKTIAEPASQIAACIRGLGAEPGTCKVGIATSDELGAVARAVETLAQGIEERTRLLESEGNYLNAILMSMSEGVLISDTKGRIARVNPAFLEIFGILETPIGKTALEVVRTPAIEVGIQKVLADKADHEEEMTLGNQVLLARFAALQSQNALLGSVIVFHDITRLRRLEGIRKDFVSNVSHELKTPLTSIHGYTETLLEEKCNSDVHNEFLPRIFRNAQQLSQLIEELLRLSKLENGAEQLEKQTLDFDGLMRDLQKELAARFEQKRIQFVVEAAADARCFTAREPYIRRVFLNLIDNALKYTDTGSVKVSARRSGHEIVFAVTDTGSGIPPEDLVRVFERFYRVNKDRSRQSGGSGIGLALVKHIVQLHGGRVWAESTVGRGTTISFTLPGQESATEV